eukprot:SAG25_NODE_3405_length_1094_cov_2.267337_1_plen_50_part_10
MYRDGDEANAFYIVVFGQLGVAPGTLTTLPEDSERLGPGDTFGDWDSGDV